MKPLKIISYTVANGMGLGLMASLSALRNKKSGLRPCDFDRANMETWIGRVEGVEDHPVNGDLADFDCRNNRLADICLAQDGFAEAVAAIREEFGPSRIGVFVGSSTSGSHQLELAYRERESESDKLPSDFRYQQTFNLFAAADFVTRRLNLGGPSLAISTACSSSAKAFAAAQRYIEAGLCDAAVVGGVDSLCLTTLFGFFSLSLMAQNPCCPWDPEREGINIGEAAGFALLRPAREGEEGVALIGHGESSDAYHMTAPHPDGVGAILSMRGALAGAGREPEEVDYINLHGTATLSNDALEDKAVMEVFGRETRCSSTKGWSGHTLGAAGITEAVIACLAITENFMPCSLNTRSVDETLGANVLLENREGPVNVVLSNSFGFGGNNCSLLFGRLS